MKNYLILILAAIFIASAMPAMSQDFGPEFGVLGKVFGYNQLGMDVSSPSEYSINPAVILDAIALNGGKSYFEADFGRFDFSQGPEVNTTWVYAVKAIDDSQAIRLGFYSSSGAPAPSKLGIDAGVSIVTGEVAYARRVGHGLTLGLSFSPEIAQTEAWVDGSLLAKGQAKLNPNVRIGATWQPYYWLMTGATIAFDDFRSETTNYDSGAVVGKTSGNYKQRLATLGAFAVVQKGTYVSLHYQFGILKGPGLDENISLTSVTLTQFASENLSFAYTYQDHGNDFALQYRDTEWCGGLSLGNNAYRQLAPYFGTAKTCFVWLGKAF